MDTMETLLQICTIANGAAAVVSIIISLVLYTHGLNRERKIETLKSLAEIRRKYFNTKRLNDQEKLAYINELEYFSTGINTGIYDIKIVKRMSGSRLIRQYENWAEDFIKDRREKFGNNQAYSEYVKLIKKLKKQILKLYLGGKMNYFADFHESEVIQMKKANDNHYNYNFNPTYEYKTYHYVGRYNPYKKGIIRRFKKWLNRKENKYKFCNTYEDWKKYIEEKFLKGISNHENFLHWIIEQKNFEKQYWAMVRLVLIPIYISFLAAINDFYKENVLSYFCCAAALIVIIMFTRISDSLIRIEMYKDIIKITKKYISEQKKAEADQES